jgi:hypothetical protein
VNQFIANKVLVVCASMEMAAKADAAEEDLGEVIRILEQLICDKDAELRSVRR